MDLDPRLEIEKELAKEELAQIIEKDRQIYYLICLMIT